MPSVAPGPFDPRGHDFRTEPTGEPIAPVFATMSNPVKDASRKDRPADVPLGKLGVRCVP